MTEYCFQDYYSIHFAPLCSWDLVITSVTETFSTIPNSTEALITWGSRDMNGVITKPESQKWPSLKLKTTKSWSG